MMDKDFIKNPVEAYAELKAENEKLKEKISKFRWDNPYFDLYNNVVNQRDILKAENARLKNERTADLVRQIDLWKENFEGQRNAYVKLNSMYKENCEYTNKLEQTLQEIKAIASGKSILTYEIKEILDLITKAEEE